MKRINCCKGRLCQEWRLQLICICFLATISGCTSDQAVEQNKLTQQEENSTDIKPVRTEVGEASWYGPRFHGKKTATGEVFDQTKMTAAHPTLPLGTKAEVTNLENDKKVEVKINDRGPYVDDRVIDVSRAAAKKLDMVEEGTAQVKIETKIPEDKDSTGHSNKKE